ncbi:hypothetical protein ACW5R3_07940 [Bizionia sp. KMM 8389]
MKNINLILVFLVCMGSVYSQTTSEKTSYCNDVSKHVKNENPFDGIELGTLVSSDTISGFQTEPDKLKISGIVYLADGITPAKDVMIHIQQANNDGAYTLVSITQSNYIENSLLVKTNEKGYYEMYTYIPGHTNKPLTYPHEYLPSHIHIQVKEPFKESYSLNSLLFDTDTLLTKACRKRLARKKIDSVLELKEVGGMLVTTKNIVLKSEDSES